MFWDVNRFADKSSCATDPICKMLHLMGQLLHFHLRPSLPGQILSKRYFIYVPILIIILPIIPKRKKLWQLSNVCLDQGWKGKVFFTWRDGPGQWRGLNLQGGAQAHTAYITWLKPYATSEEALICIALSEISKIYSTFIIMIIIMIIIIVQCCHIGW